jgi:UDP:flavonoid glycosyltransferase YjiC (YdhE family)
VKFLFVVPPLTGHVNPTISVARALEARGHEVAWVGHPGKVRPLLPANARLFALPENVAADHAAAVRDKAANTRGAAALKFLWEDFLVPLARSMRPGVEAAVSEFAPDVMCVDQQAVAGGLVARARGIRWATLATTSAGISDPLAALPQVKRWFEDLIGGLEREAGLPRAGELSPQLVLAFTTSALVPAPFPAHYKLVGPSIADRPETAEFPFERLRRPSVLVSMGTVNAEASGRFYNVALAALADQPYQVILVAPPELVPHTPANFITRAYVPQLALLSRVDAVVCHGGHNTTCEALAHGLPLVIAPIKDDQPIVADQVVAAGAGIRIKFGRVQAPELRDAVSRALADEALRAGAARVRDSFAAAGGSAAAAEYVCALAARRGAA